MAGVIAVSPKFQFESSAGAPLVNGTVDVYVAGTVTRSNTWQDQAQTTLNTNPIVLDSRGEALIWLDPAITYDFVLKNSGGVTQYTAEDISGASSAAALAASGGASLVGFIQSGAGAVASTLQGKGREIFSVWDFMTAAQIADANVGAGPTNNNHSAAFAAAIAASVLAGHKRLWVNPVLGAYSVRDVDIPAGFGLVGYARCPYNPTTVSAVYGMGSVIVRATGGTNLFRWAGGSRVHGVVLHGNGKTADCFETSTGARIDTLNIDECGIYGFRRGVGNSTYIGTTRVTRCNIAQNTTGIYSLVDSETFGNYINVNDTYGIDQEAGANDCSFFGDKIEFNGSEGANFFDSVNCTLLPNVIDRNGRAGVRVAGTSTVTIPGGTLRRNGSAILGNAECAHIYVEGANAKVKVGVIQTATGANDDGSGSTTPNYVFSFGGASVGEFVAAGGSATGYVTSAVNYGVTPTVCKIIGVAGVEDRVNSGLAQVLDGRRYYTRNSFANVAPAGTTATMNVTLSATSTFSRSYFKMTVEARDATDAGSIVGEALLLIYREAGGASAQIIPTPSQAYVTGAGVPTLASTHFGPAGSTLQVNAASVAADGSTLTLSITNNHGTRTFGAILEVSDA